MVEVNYTSEKYIDVVMRSDGGGKNTIKLEIMHFFATIVCRLSHIDACGDGSDGGDDSVMAGVGNDYDGGDRGWW